MVGLEGWGSRVYQGIEELEICRLEVVECIVVEIRVVFT